MTSQANAALLESWTLSLHGKSPKTASLYLRTARWFEEWLTANGRPADRPGDLLAVTRQDAEAWFGAQRAAGLQPATLRSRWIALRNLYGWALDEDEITVNPMAKVKVEKANPKPTRMVSSADLAALLKACEGRDFLDRRDYALVRMMVATGLRLSEILGLRVVDLDLTKRVAFVEHGKGDRARFVRFDAQTAQALDRYKRARARHTHATSPWLWISRLGRLSNNGVPYILNRRAEMAGIDHVHPHALRHTWADRCKSAGMSDSDLKELGGWESDEVMRRYGSARAVDRALAAYDTVSPMGDL